MVRKHAFAMTIGVMVLIAVVVVATGFHFEPHSIGMMMAEGAAAASAGDLKKMAEALEDATKKFSAKSDELSKKADDAMSEVKNKGKLLDDTKAEVDKLLVEHTTMAAERNKLTSELADAKARLSGLEQEVARRPNGPGAAAHKSIGAQIAADEKFKTWAKETDGRGRFRATVNAAITSVDVADGIVEPTRVPGTVEQPKQRLFVRDLIPVGQTESPAIFWIQMTGFTNNAAVVSENTRKPESTITYTPKTTAVATIAHIFKASKQILADFRQLRTDVDREMRYGLKYVEEREILFGDGTGNNLHGIVPQASNFDPAFTVANHNRIDDIRLAILQSQIARLPATGIVMHYQDWARTELIKDANGQYVFANPLRLANSTLWGLPVVPTEIDEFVGRFLTGAFAGGAQIYDREQMGVEFATENEDDFVKNMITGRCEERVGLAVFRPEAFIEGAFTGATT